MDLKARIAYTDRTDIVLLFHLHDAGHIQREIIMN
jgi:hypothetical protein